jgi:hypothetical protein
MTTDTGTPDYPTPGTVTNGHVLTADYQWVPLPPEAPAPVRRDMGVKRDQVTRVVAVKPINHLAEWTWTICTAGLYAPVYAWKVWSRRFVR